jgi:WD40 repeat protein
VTTGVRIDEAFMYFRLFVLAISLASGCSESRPKLGPIRPIYNHKGESDICDVFFIPDSEKYVVVESGRVLAFDMATETPLESVRIDNWIVNGFCFGTYSARNKQIYLGRSDLGICCFDSESLISVDQPKILGSKFFHELKDSQDFITIRNRSELCRIDADSGSIKWKTTIRKGRYFAHDFHSELIAINENLDGTVEKVSFIELSGGTPTGYTIRHSAPIRGLAFSSDGSLLATTCDDGFVRVHDLVKQKTIWEQKNDVDGAFAVAIHPNDDYVAVGCMRGIKIWSLKTRSMVSSWNGHSWFADCMSFSNDGEYLLSGSPDDTAALWRTRELIGRIEYVKPY